MERPHEKEIELHVPADQDVEEVFCREVKKSFEPSHTLDSATRRNRKYNVSP